MIPKIIHQLWIGPHEPPSQMMQTWKDKHPNFEYILWNESEFERRGRVFACQRQIDMCQTYDGKADIMRWEILFDMGGVFIDADSICIESIDDGTFMTKTAFACFENENIRKDLVSNGTVGFVPGHPALKHMIDRIRSGELDDRIQNYKAWYAVGPVLLTDTLNTGQFKDVAIYPSHTFLPIHFTGLVYEGHKKVYAYQEWSSTHAKNDRLHSMATVPDEMRPSNKTVSVVVLVDEQNTQFLQDCLASIRAQTGRFCIEIICIYDDTPATIDLLDTFKRTTRFITMQHYMHNLLDAELSRIIGRKKATGEYIMYIDAANLMTNTCLRDHMTAIETTQKNGCKTRTTPFHIVNGKKMFLGRSEAAFGRSEAAFGKSEAAFGRSEAAIDRSNTIVQFERRNSDTDTWTEIDTSLVLERVYTS